MTQTMRQFKNGLVDQNPTLVLLLGMCPTLAVSTSLTNAVGMGLAATAVLICSNVVISALRKLIPDKIRIAAFVVVIAGFVTAVDYLLQAFAPALSDSLGMFIPLIVVNCIILARAEAFASKNGVVRSAIDGLAMGMGFTMALIFVAAVRELLSAGTLFEFTILPDAFPKIDIMGQPPGGFIVLGVVIAVMQAVRNRSKAKNAAGL
ncbi:MAG: electron transport complex subunit E [Oscillospiraceae bacterium]|jgi:electron transport complex protein RnfE|nr:electron transport complex subunit E [Oscillospiraceae bacterium]